MYILPEQNTQPRKVHEGKKMNTIKMLVWTRQENMEERKRKKGRKERKER